MDGDRDHQSEALYVPIIRMVRRFIGDKVASDLIADELAPKLRAKGYKGMLVKPLPVPKAL